MVVVVHRSGSSAVTANFFAELADVLDCLSTTVNPVVVAGDMNIRLDRVSNSNAVAFGDLITSYGLTRLVDDITHDNGGTLDVCAFVMINHCWLWVCSILGFLNIDCSTESRVCRVQH